MASSNLILVCLIVALVGLVSAKPGFLPISSQQQQHLQRTHGGHLRQRIQEAIEEEQAEKARPFSADDYEDFPMVPPLLRLSYNVPEEEYFKTPGKRYLGIDIPDYISTGGKADAIKSMSNKMKAMGKK